jgi:protein tyrosine/serine phosphatase
MQHSLKTPLGRLLAWLDMHLVDHGLVRTAYNNFYALGEGMYRLSQPSPAQLRRYQRQHGIRTVINLRGDNSFGSYVLEADACERLGITLIDHRLYSRQLPSVEEIVATRELFDRIDYPAMLHCKSGADRAGLGSVLYCHFRLGQPIAQAIGQLQWFYGHFRFGNTGSMDYFFQRYLADNAREPMAFIDWVLTRYDRSAMVKDFQTAKRSRLGTWFVDKFLRRE